MVKKAFHQLVLDVRSESGLNIVTLTHDEVIEVLTEYVNNKLSIEASQATVVKIN